MAVVVGLVDCIVSRHRYLGPAIRIGSQLKVVNSLAKADSGLSNALPIGPTVPILASVLPGRNSIAVPVPVVSGSHMPTPAFNTKGISRATGKADENMGSCWNKHLLVHNRSAIRPIVVVSVIDRGRIDRLYAAGSCVVPMSQFSVARRE